MKYLIAGHGELPQKTLNTLELLLGPRDNIVLISEKLDSNDYKEEADRLIAQYAPDGLIVFTDIIEGAVNQYIAKKLKDYDFWLIAGYNVSLLLELILRTDLTIEDIDEITANASNDMVYVNDLMRAAL